MYLAFGTSFRLRVSVISVSLANCCTGVVNL
jgi:hypothetical protein